jgi:metal-responsive CopG/Arc/MetJ family transcriptional regulator
MVKAISVSLDNWIVDVIDKKAKEDNKNRSELINEILIKALTNFQTIHEE